jgi:cytochrome b561
MPLKNTNEAYGSVAKFLHWAIVLLILPQWFLAEAAEEWPSGSAERAGLFDWHISIGLLVLVLAVARIGWKVVNGGQPAPLGTVGWQRKSAAIGHGLLYLLILAQPLSGWVMSSTGGHDVALLGLPFPALGAENHDLHETLEDVHEALFKALLVVALVHVAAALYRHWVLRDATLRRMLPFGRG